MRKQLVARRGEEACIGATVKVFEPPVEEEAGFARP